MGLRGVAHYPDDFILCSAAGLDGCTQLLLAFDALTKELGVPLASAKKEGPAPKLS